MTEYLNTVHNPALRAARMHVGVAHVLLQLSHRPMELGCAETVARRLCRCTSTTPACVEYIKTGEGDGFVLTEYGERVKQHLRQWVKLA